MWNQIARTVAGSEHLDLWDSAGLGLLNVALAYGYVGSFDTKYDNNFWRPVTAIQAAATDGNPLTSPDPAWTSLVPTTPIPDLEEGSKIRSERGRARIGERLAEGDGGQLPATGAVDVDCPDVLARTSVRPAKAVTNSQVPLEVQRANTSSSPSGSL